MSATGLASWLRPDPPLRPDGRCAVCPKQRHPERSKKYGGAEAERDPFCSSVCARQFFGCELEVKRAEAADV